MSLRGAAIISGAERATTVRALQRELGVEMGTKNNSKKKKQLDTITAYHPIKRDRERDRAPALKPLSLLTHTRLYVQVGSPPRPAA